MVTIGHEHPAVSMKTEVRFTLQTATNVAELHTETKVAQTTHFCVAMAMHLVFKFLTTLRMTQQYVV
jgi:metallophosphoesterase superfamily enzyme